MPFAQHVSFRSLPLTACRLPLPPRTGRLLDVPVRSCEKEQTRY